MRLLPRIIVVAVALLLIAIPTRADEATVEGPTPAATVAPAPITDLNPRPLGLPNAAPKFTKQPAAAAPATSAPTAVSTLLDNPVVRTTLSLGVVIGLILICGVAFRKLSARAGGGGGLLAAAGAGGAAPAGILEILGRYPIARGQTLILLKLDRRILLLSQTTPRIRAGTGTLTTLAEISDPEDVASILLKVQDADGASNSARFQSLLGRFDSAHPADAEPTTLSLRETRASADGDRTEMGGWDTHDAAATFPLVPPLADARTPIAPLPSSDSFGSLRQRLSALNGEAHR